MVLLVTLKFQFHRVTKTVFAVMPKVFLLTFFLPKSKPILLGILYRPPNKSDFVKHTNNVFTETGVLDKKECYLLGDLNQSNPGQERNFHQQMLYIKKPKFAASNKGLSRFLLLLFSGTTNFSIS